MSDNSYDSSSSDIMFSPSLIDNNYIQTLKNDKTYIFGDIEGDENLFASTVGTISTAQNERFIFLGDLYDYTKPNETISMIGTILNALGVEILQPFNEQSREIDIIRAYRKLWKIKQMKAYSKFNIQYLHSKLKREQLEPNFKYLFILGNKEVIFVQEIITCEHMTKKAPNTFQVPADYKFKHVEEGREPIKHTNYLFTTEQLNIMFSYLSLCINYALIDETIYIHCYINYKHVKDDIPPVKRIISGHSKGYGKFADTDFPGVNIYLCDLTGLINNNLNNYIINDHDTIIYNFNDNIKPCLNKISFDIDDDVVVSIDENPKRSKPYIPC